MRRTGGPARDSIPIMVQDLDLWSEFNVAMLGATAALAGLVIVASSVNIAEIVKANTLTARLASAIAGLVLAIVASASALIPGIDDLWYGAVLIVCALGAGVFQLNATIVIARDPAPEDHARVSKAVLGFLPIAAYLAAGVAIMLGNPSGLILAAVGALIAIVVAIIVSWIVLVEVLR